MARTDALRLRCVRQGPDMSTRLSTTSILVRGSLECLWRFEAGKGRKGARWPLRDRTAECVFPVSFYCRSAEIGASRRPSARFVLRRSLRLPLTPGEVVKTEEMFVVMHRTRSYALVGSREAQEKQTSCP